MSKKNPNQGNSIFKLKVILEGSDPLIWRCFEVLDTTTLGDLHYILQIVMGWENCHMHEFRKGSNRYGPIHPDGYGPGYGLYDEGEYTVQEMFKRKGNKLQYVYDFGDEWLHTIVHEGRVTLKESITYPVCTAGERQCPPEDCGGIYGYFDLLESLKDPTHFRHKEFQEWLPEDYDPNIFDIENVNQALSKMEEPLFYAKYGDLFDEEDENMFDYAEPVSLLMTLGFPEQKTDYLKLGLNRDHVPELIQMATDMELHHASSDSSEVFAPAHAWRALGQLRAEVAIEPLLSIMWLADEEQDDWINEDLPDVFRAIGPAAIPALAEYVQQEQHGLWSRTAAATSLGKIGNAYPESRDACVEALTDTLKHYNRNDAELNAFLITNLVDLKAVESAAVMEAAFAADAVDCCVMGDWEEVQIELGLLNKHITPRPKSWLMLGSHINHRSAIRHTPPPTGKKAGTAKKKRKAQKKARKKNRKK